MLQLQKVSYAYETERILSDLTTTFRERTVYSILGKSGCGKTTLLKLASGLLTPTNGRIMYDKQSLHHPDASFSYMFQNPNLLPWQTVLQNVCMPFVIRHRKDAMIEKRALHLLSQMGIGALAERYPDELSGGQRSRVALCRALMTNPRVLFLDEPFSALDVMTKEQLQDDLVALVQEREMTVIFITHDIEEAIIIADEIRVMEAGRFIYEEQNPLREQVVRRDTEQALSYKRLLRSVLEGAYA